MTNMKVICRICNRPVRTPFDTRHKRSCEPGDHSDIGLIEEGEEEESKPTNKFGEEHEKRTHSWCSACERDVFSLSLSAHKANCREDDPSDIAVVPPEGEDTDPVCSRCSLRIEPGKYEKHVKECAVSNHGSDLGVLEEE